MGKLIVRYTSALLVISAAFIAGMHFAVEFMRPTL